MEKKTRLVSVMTLAVGDIVQFHGARFLITSTAIFDSLSEDPADTYMRANGQCLEGNAVPGYFGPGKNWNFQGNRSVTVQVEV